MYRDRGVGKPLWSFHAENIASTLELQDLISEPVQQVVALLNQPLSVP